MTNEPLAGDAIHREWLILLSTVNMRLGGGLAVPGSSRLASRAADVTRSHVNDCEFLARLGGADGSPVTRQGCVHATGIAVSDGVLASSSPQV
jgi:hypothetical protein